MTPPRVVVGIDDSSAARAALAWAVDEAILRRAELHIVHACQPSGLIMPAIAYGAAYTELAESAEALVHTMTAEVRVKAGDRLPGIGEVATEGDPGARSWNPPVRPTFSSWGTV